MSSPAHAIQVARSRRTMGFARSQRAACSLAALWIDPAGAYSCSHPNSDDDFWYGKAGPLLVGGPTLLGLRARLAAASVRLIMQNDAAPGRGPLLDIGDMSAIFHAAFATGGARGLLDLLEQGLYERETTAAVARLGPFNGTVVHRAYKAQLGILYDPKFLVRHGYEWAAAVPDHAWSPRAAYYSKLAVVQGGLWWVRHWAGEFLGEQILRRRHIDAVEVVWWLQAQQLCRRADFATVAMEHGVIWYVVAAGNLIRAEGSYPAAHAAKWCGRYALGMGRWYPTVRTDLGRECRHGFGHAVYYWLAMRDQPARRLRGFSSFGHTLRVGGPRGLQLSKKEMEAGIATCADAVALHPSLVTDCINGLFHSYDTMSPRSDAALKEYLTGARNRVLVNATRWVATSTDHVVPDAVPAELRRWVASIPPQGNYTSDRPMAAAARLPDVLELAEAMLTRLHNGTSLRY